MTNSSVINLFYKYSLLPIDIIKIIIYYCKCNNCHNMAFDTCMYCNECYCHECYSPYYGLCICNWCSPKLF